METTETAILIGMPKLLQAEGRHTPCAMAWINAHLCEIVLARLAIEVAEADVQVGVTDTALPVARVTSACSPLRRRELMAKALRAAALAIADTERLMDQGGVPQNLSMCRTLAVNEIQMKGRVTEYRLTLLDLSDSQHEMLIGRDWTASSHNARISLTLEGYKREERWLSNLEII